MKRILTLAILVILIATTAIIFISCSENSNVLFVYFKKNSIDEDYIRKEFKEQTGISLKFKYYNTDDEMYTKLKGAKNLYDLALSSDDMVSKMSEEGMLEKVDFTNVPNYTLIDSQYKNLKYDPENQYSVPYMWGTFGIIFNKQLINDKVDSWGFLFDQKYNKKIFMMDSVKASMGMALKYLGYSLNTKNIEELDKAGQLLINQKPLVLAYTGDEIKDKMINNEGAIAAVFSTDASLMISSNKNLEYIIPKEGTHYWFKSVVILKGSKNKAQAELFINFLCKTEVALVNAKYFNDATPHLEAKKLLTTEIVNNSVTYPLLKSLSNSEVALNYGDLMDKYNQIWIDVKNVKSK